VINKTWISLSLTHERQNFHAILIIYFSALNRIANWRVLYIVVLYLLVQFFCHVLRNVLPHGIEMHNENMSSIGKLHFTCWCVKYWLNYCQFCVQRKLIHFVVCFRFKRFRRTIVFTGFFVDLRSVQGAVHAVSYNYDFF